MNKTQIKKVIEQLYKDNLKLIQDDSENLFKIIKKNFKEKTKLEKEIYNFLFDEFTAILFNTLKVGSKIYKTWDRNKQIDFSELLYNDDGLTLEQRIRKAIKDSKDEQYLFYRIYLIEDTETMSITFNGLKAKANIEYVEITGDDCCGECSDSYGTYEEVNAPAVPLHPGCHCDAYPLEADDAKLTGNEDEE